MVTALTERASARDDMIDPRYHGKKIEEIPDAAFWPGFDPEERWPALALASLVTVPAGNTEGWLLASESCGGFSCNSCEAAVLPLPVHPEILGFLETVAEEAFSPEPLDYLNMFDAGKVAAVRNGYLSALQSAGLSCNAANLDLFTQALYPVDATPENLRLLTGTDIDLSVTGVSGELVIFIVGQNCD